MVFVTTLATLAVLPLTRALSLFYIGAEGAGLLENASAFPSCGLCSKMFPSMSCGGSGARETQQAVNVRGKIECLKRYSTAYLTEL
ncbi:hypothetical protein CVD28_08005 [Bacillus sp. M6-12]|uniref:hypothetical protein n=1 Tax=Bacillus sp. M6-12 TaxID=2054166 RepID=UPI000C784B32|nr:hypothetical protein [Bacillus sp. M6-12]PLS18222.1 hypothetical protein CVD28_08005 [Bacillus sp. M6-12]